MTARLAATDRSLMLFAPSAYPLGGVATWISYLLPGLRAGGWRPTLALAQGRWHDPHAYLASHPYAPVICVPCGAGTQASRVREAMRAIEWAAPDLVAVVNMPDAILAAARLRRRGLFNGKIAAVEHGFARQTLIDIRALKGELDGLVGTNKLTLQLASRFASIPPSRLYYAPCGATPQSAPYRTGRGSETLILLYVGRLEAEQKRVQDLPALAAELYRRGVAFRLLIAGGGPQEPMLRQALQGAANVEFLGVVEEAKLCEIVLPQADALLVLSTWETGPLVAWEAMAAGVAVVCSRYVGSGAERALVDGENCLMFPTGDMRAAAAAIGRLRDPEVAAKLSQAGAALVEQRYSREISIACWREAFTSILALPPLAPSPARLAIKGSGRLDRWFGPTLGDGLRRAFGRRYEHAEPGGEWPHLLTRSDSDVELYAQLVAACEAGRP
jgi:glycosyltransferase involved in cell wall biosynthesis